MEETPYKAELDRFIEAFVANGVEFIVIGGQAEALYGSPRVTYDVDLCHRRTPENIRRLAEALKEFNPKLRDLPAGLPNIVDAQSLLLGTNFTLSTSLIDLDLLGQVDPIGGYDQLLPHAVEFSSYAKRFLAIGLDDLLKVKLHINRPKDQESIMQLRAIKSLRDSRDKS